MRRALAAALILLGGCAHLGPVQDGVPAGSRYVAMGSSYAAGTALGGIKPGTPQRCGRSPQSYASLVAERLHLALDDQTCGGATTAHILGPWSELPPQIAAVDAQTRLVTVTIGGNDLGYVMNLFAASCREAEGMTIQGRKVGCPRLRPPVAADYAKLETSLRQIAQEVRRRAPKARLIFVQYVKLIPDAPCDTLHLSAEGALATRVIGEGLARVTARAAEAEGVEVLSAQDLSRDHTACDAAPWSVGPEPAGPDANTPWHPTRAGHAAIADALAGMLRR